MRDYEDTFPQLPQKWDEWKLRELLGEGSYGKVYKASRQIGEDISYSAIKIITIPGMEEEKDVKNMLGDYESAKEYYQSVVDMFLHEIQMMEKLKGITNIVTIQDYCVVEKTEEIRWQIFIRMELLTSLTEYQTVHIMTEEDVIRMGIDICTALEYCEKQKIIHRDIKPENVLISDMGNYKLVDFGVAKKLEGSMSVHTVSGTFTYMAPEVYKREKYDHRVDIYSLGIMMYRLLNHNREPFLPVDQKLIRYKNREEALERRMNGETAASPVEAGERTAKIILKAIHYQPDMRYASATDLKKDLQKLLLSEEENGKTAGSKKWLKIGAGILCLGCILFAGYIMGSKRSQVQNYQTEELRTVEAAKENDETETTMIVSGESRPIDRKEYQLSSDQDETENVTEKGTENETENLQEMTAGNTSKYEQVDITSFCSFDFGSDVQEFTPEIDKKALKTRLIPKMQGKNSDKVLDEIVENLAEQFQFNKKKAEVKDGDTIIMKYQPQKQYQDILHGQNLEFQYSDCRLKMQMNTEYVQSVTQKNTVVKNARRTEQNSKETEKKADTNNTTAVKEKESVRMSDGNVKLDVGKRKQLSVLGTNTAVTWKSSDQSVAKVSSKGIVLAVAPGKAVITAKVGKKSYRCQILVNKRKEYFNNNLSEDYGLVSVKPYHVYYKGEKVYAECYVINGFDHPVWNIYVTSLTLSDRKNVFANAAFGRMENVYLGAHCYVKWTFVFEKNAVLHQNADLDYLRYSASTAYSY